MRFCPLSQHTNTHHACIHSPPLVQQSLACRPVVQTHTDVFTHQQEGWRVEGMDGRMEGREKERTERRTSGAEEERV